MRVLVKEKDSKNGVDTIYEFSERTDHLVECTHRSHYKNTNKFGRDGLELFLTNLFLPAGYPQSVSPDYLQYQVWNAIQACCNSLAGLLASRSVLEGFGVGNPSASATDAMLVTIAQDVFSRLTTIASAYYLGTSLFPEAKMYRLLADVLNDLALVFDVVSPHLDEFVAMFTSYPLGSGLRIAALCLSGSLRALCGVVAGGSKAALTLHFAASSTNGPGDIGDLNAKDGSKETVLALLGLLCGTGVLPYVTTPRSTYMVLVVLILCHLAVNYVAVSGLALRTLNRQRATIAWSRFRGGQFYFNGVDLLTPKQVSLAERVLEHPARLHHAKSGATIGYCVIARSLFSIFDGPRHRLLNNRRQPRFTVNAPIHQLLDIFSRERYVLWFDTPAEDRNRPTQIYIMLKEGHTQIDHLKAWAHAYEVAMMCRALDPKELEDDGCEGIRLIGRAYVATDGTFGSFVERMRATGWRIDEGTIVVGSPSTIVVDEEKRSAAGASYKEE